MQGWDISDHGVQVVAVGLFSRGVFISLSKKEIHRNYLSKGTFTKKKKGVLLKYEIYIHHSFLFFIFYSVL